MLLAAMAARTTPDLCANIWPGAVGQFIEAGGLVDLSKFADFDSVIQGRVPTELIPSFATPSTMGGGYHQFPWKTNPVMMLYNVGLFRSVGLTKPPRTYSDFWAAARKLTRDRDGNGQIDAWIAAPQYEPIWWQRFFDFYPFYLAAGEGRTLIENGRVVFDSPAADSAMAFFQTGFARGYFPRSKFQFDSFLSGQIAVLITGPYAMPALDAAKPPGFAYAAAPIPVPDGTPDDGRMPVTYGDPKNLAVFSTTKHPEAAWAFLKFLVSPESDAALLAQTQQLPIRAHLLTDSATAGFFANHPGLVPFARQAERTRGVDSAPELKEAFDLIAQSFESSAVLSIESPKDAVTGAAHHVQRLLDVE